MSRKNKVLTIVGTLIVTAGQHAQASTGSLAQSSFALDRGSIRQSQNVGLCDVMDEAQKHSYSFSQTSIEGSTPLLIAGDPFNPTEFKTTFDRDPQFLAWATRKGPFFRFLVDYDLIGMTRDKVTELLGPAQLLDGPEKKEADKQAPADPDNSSPGYLLVTRISGDKLVATGVQMEFKAGKVARWRYFSSTNHYPINKPADAFRVDNASRWVTYNVVESDICDYGMKIKRSMGFANPEGANDAYEDSRPSFDVLAQKVLPTTEEVLPMILLPIQPTSNDFVNAAALAQNSLLVKASREYIEQAISLAKTDAERKKAKAFLIARLPTKTPSWTVEKRHLEAYAASKRKESATAFAAYEQNVHADPGFEYSYYMLGMLKREALNFAGAQEQFEKVLAINPRYQKALFGLAAIKMQNKETEIARKMAEQAYFLYPYDASAHAMYLSIVNEEPPKEQPAGLYAASPAASKSKGKAH